MINFLSCFLKENITSLKKLNNKVLKLNENIYLEYESFLKFKEYKINKNFINKEKKIYIYLNEIILSYFEKEYYVEILKITEENNILPIIIIDEVTKNKTDFIIENFNFNFKIIYKKINEDFLKEKETNNFLFDFEFLKYKDQINLNYLVSDKVLSCYSKRNKKNTFFNEEEIDFLNLLKENSIKILNLNIKNEFSLFDCNLHSEEYKEYILLKNFSSKNVDELINILDYNLIETNSSIEENIRIIEKLEEYKPEILNLTFNKKISNENIILLKNDLFEDLETFINNTEIKEKKIERIKLYDLLS